MSPSREHAASQSGLKGWLGEYLALTIWLTAIAGTGLGMLVGGTLAWSNVDHELKTHQDLLDKYGKRQEILETGMGDVDRRFNAQTLALHDSESRMHDENQKLDKALGILDARVGLFGSRTIPAQPQGGNQ